MCECVSVSVCVRVCVCVSECVRMYVHVCAKRNCTLKKKILHCLDLTESAFKVLDAYVRENERKAAALKLYNIAHTRVVTRYGPFQKSVCRSKVL